MHIPCHRRPFNLNKTANGGLNKSI